jgi:hopanoid-associated phosphorylase
LVDRHVSIIASAQPVIAVTGLSFEARIASGNGITALCSNDERKLAALLDAAIAAGTSGIISFGVAGGLLPSLIAGTWIVAAAIATERGRFPTDPTWSTKIAAALPGAMLADIAAFGRPMATASDKQSLLRTTGAVAVDMESGVAAAAAAAHGLPFAACRIILNAAWLNLPPAALAGFRADGTLDLAAVLSSLMRRPDQLPALLRLARAAHTVHTSLRHGRALLGPTLGFAASPASPQ